jgi:16S rRNA (cytidine1402-2'-O)-methyltransferase
VSPAGELIFVGTPIGNVGDLSPRAREVLSRADVVCCEDTRHSGQLFARLGIHPKRLLSLHEHNEASRSPEVIGLIGSGATVAVVSDAGMPAVSDPGSRLASAAHEAGARVTVVPGPSSATAAVAVAGLGGDRFGVEGFLPRRGAERRSRLSAVAAATSPVVLFEAPRRVEALVADLLGVCEGSRLVTVCRELTKLHEEVWRGALADALGRWPPESAKGEFVLVIAGRATAAPAELPADEVAATVAHLVSSGLSRRDAVGEVADRMGTSPRVVYDALKPSAETGAPPPGL